jgi:hypothetical protein
MVTDRDNDITKHFEKYHYATIAQIERLFFREVDSSYVIANRRLKRLAKAGFIKPLYDDATNKLVYKLSTKDEKIPDPGLHRILVLDVYAELAYLGYDIETFSVEKWWAGGKYRSDGFVIFKVGNRRYRFFVEVQLANHDPNIPKYDELYKTGEVTKELHTDYYPDVLLVADREYKQDFNLQFSKVIQVNTKLTQLSKIIMG